jgi:HEAT repeat protein
MTKTLFLTVVAVATTHLATAQPRVVVPSPVPLAAPSPAPAPQASPVPPAAPAPPAPPERIGPFDFRDQDFDIDIDPSQWAAFGQSFEDLVQSLKDQKLDLKAQIKGAPNPVLPPRPLVRAGNEEGTYDQARQMIERDQYERALPVLDRVIEAKGNRVDAAMYWKAYSLSKLTRRPEALTVLADLQKEYPNGAWVRDARALDVEIRQASGQSVSADMPDDDVKLLALRGLMQSDPDSAIPVIERMLQGNSSVRVKNRALFVLSQSRAPRARDVITGVARNGSNPELRLAAVRLLGQRSDPESLKVLGDMYASTTDIDVRRQILRSLGAGNARDRLVAVAKSEKSPELRMIAVQQLGATRAAAELEELYRSETDKDVKERILQSFVAANAPERLAAIARSEKDPDLQQTAIRSLGAMNRPESLDALLAIYRSDAPLDTKKTIINALSMRENCSTLVGLAKTEKNKELQSDMVRRLSNVANRCSEAHDYMLELLK